jgi:hypothetical protein
LLIDRIRKNKFVLISNFGFLISLCVVPFIFSFLHGDILPYRIYSVILPFFSFLMAKSLLELIKHINISRFKNWGYFVAIYLMFHFIVASGFVYYKLGDDLKNGKRNQNLLFQYYSHHFKPNESIDQYLKSNYTKHPLYLIEPEEQGIPHYLSFMDIDYEIIDEQELEELINKGDTLVVVTRFRDPFINQLHEYDKRCITDAEFSYHNFIVVSKHN